MALFHGRTREWLVACVIAAAAGVAIHAFGQTTPRREQQPTTRLADDSRDFISKMTIANLAEVQLGQLAVEKASSTDVKAFAQMMIKDHTQANKELASAASAAHVQPPADIGATHRELAERLKSIQPRDFDREYVTAMIEGHRDLERQLQARLGRTSPAADPSGANRPSSAAAGQSPAGTSGRDPGDALDRWARKTLPVVQQHLEQAQQLQQNIK